MITALFKGLFIISSIGAKHFLVETEGNFRIYRNWILLPWSDSTDMGEKGDKESGADYLEPFTPVFHKLRQTVIFMKIS